VLVKQTDSRYFGAFVIVAGVALLNGGCTIARWYSGVPLHGDPAVLVQGESTKSDVLQLFGPPTQITHQTDGDAFIYAYDRWNYSSFTVAEPITGQRVFTYTRGFNNRDRLVVLFDFYGVVRGIAVEHRTEEMPVL
jgi:hypothetical protein